MNDTLMNRDQEEELSLRAKQNTVGTQEKEHQSLCLHGFL